VVLAEACRDSIMNGLLHPRGPKGKAAASLLTASFLRRPLGSYNSTGADTALTVIALL